MTDTSLIDRLKEISESDPLDYPDHTNETALEAIAALTTPTSEEVAEAIPALLDHGWGDVCDILQRLDRENQRLENQLAQGIHSCSQYCQRPMCVMQRKLDLVTEQRDRFRKQSTEALMSLDAIASGDIDDSDINDYCVGEVVRIRAMGESE